MAIGKVTNRTARKNLRRKSMTSQEYDVGLASVAEGLVCQLPAGSKIVIDSITIYWSEAQVGTTGTYQIGHRIGATADPNSLVDVVTMGSSGTPAIFAVTTETIATTLQTHKAWPGKSVLPAGSTVTFKSVKGNGTAGKCHITVNYWEFDDEYD